MSCPETVGPSSRSGSPSACPRTGASWMSAGPWRGWTRGWLEMDPDDLAYYRLLRADRLFDGFGDDPEEDEEED